MSKITTYKSIVGSIIFISCTMLLVGCSLQKVHKTPAPEQYAKIDSNFYDNGFPKQKQPWVVFSDRSNNKINATTKEDPNVVYKETSFLAPFVVLKKKGGMFKVAEYKPDLINDGKLPKTKQLKVAGWIQEEHLLLWSNSLKSSQTGFASKAAIVVNHQDVINHSEKYVENDSAIVYTNPDLISKTGKKISLGSIVYIYKQSEDKKRMLIGKQQSVIPDSIQNNIYGWISSNMVSVWGERFSVKTASDSLGIIPAYQDTITKQYAVSPKELNQRTGLESIYPVNSTDSISNHTKFFTNVFDYDKNKIYNVLGNPVFYRRYREILSDNKKLNVVFVLDVSKNNRLYIPVAKSLLQELQLNFINPDYFSSVQFGGVVYKQNSCGVSPLHSSLSNNYRDIALFFEDKIDKLHCNDTDIVQSVDRGLSAVSRMLSGKENETNLVILIGTTADQNQSQVAINALTRVNAKTIFFQTQSKSADAYNDFVLLGEKAVVNSAKNIAERKKEKIVNQNDLLIDNNYSLTTGENGIYYLDYPKQSMTQGFVIFPKKGDAMQAGILKSAIDTLLVQVTNDNKKTDSTLTRYFRSEIGVNNTRLAEMYSSLFPSTNKLIPTSIASSLLNQNASFLIDGMFVGEQDTILGGLTKSGILLNELEYEQIRSFYTNVYKQTIPAKGNLSKRECLRIYLNLVSESVPTLKKISRRKLKKMPMRELTRMTTGFSLAENPLMDLSAKEWIKNKDIKAETVLEYFEQFRETASKLGTFKGDNTIRIEHEGQVFYWLGEEYIPLLKN